MSSLVVMGLVGWVTVWAMLLWWMFEWWVLVTWIMSGWSGSINRVFFRDPMAGPVGLWGLEESGYVGVEVEMCWWERRWVCFFVPFLLEHL